MVEKIDPGTQANLFPLPEVFREFSSFCPEKKEDIPAVELPEVREKAPCMEVQAAMIREEFLNIKELQFENWITLLPGERMVALQELEDRVAEISHREPLLVLVTELPGRVAGRCNGEDLMLSEEYVMDNSYTSYRSMLDTFFHEGRHGYQFYNLNGNRVEANEALVESWENNLVLDKYHSVRMDVKEWGFRRYQEQPIEVDARVFAEQVMTELELGPRYRK